jgi:hypothetical protein
MLAIIVPNFANSQPRNFCGLFRIAPCKQVGHFGQCPKCPNQSGPTSFDRSNANRFIFPAYVHTTFLFRQRKQFFHRLEALGISMGKSGMKLFD